MTIRPLLYYTLVRLSDLAEDFLTSFIRECPIKASDKIHTIKIETSVTISKDSDGADFSKCTYSHCSGHLEVQNSRPTTCSTRGRGQSRGLFATPSVDLLSARPIRLLSDKSRGQLFSSRISFISMENLAKPESYCQKLYDAFKLTNASKRILSYTSCQT